MKFEISLDKTSKTITIGVYTLFLFILIFSYFNDSSLELLGIMSLNLLIIGILPYIFSPREYWLIGNQLIVKRPFTKVEFKLDDVTEVRLAEKDEVKNPMRLFGSGGWFGYYGKFSNFKFKTFQMYCSRMDRLVLVFTQKGLKVFSPDEPEKFINLLKEKTKQKLA